MRNESSDSGKSRWIQAFGLLLILVILVWYGYRFNPKVTLKMCMDNPVKYDGKEVGLGTEAKVAELLPDGFLLKEMGRTIRVMGDPQNASPGDYVRMRTVFHKEGYLQLKRLYVAKGKPLKILISILPVLLVLFLLLRAYRFDWRKMLIKERV